MIIKKGAKWSEGGWTIFDYDLKTKDIGIALQEVNGKSQYMINKKCDEFGFVISGSGKLFVEDKEFELKEESAFHIPIGKKSLIKGNIKFITITRPDWFPEQCEMVKE